ncbi:MULTISPECIES: YheV family putative zinc ribbon protein [Pseudoalteromonas]|uniref:DNA-binding protein n=2 Tax=Pseudoalteromonas TaxID=53246 RepID=A0A0F4QE30_9GAMM|nr:MULTISPECIES: YheV family putative zinc ribbon protein [Pseudoalteromonas]MCG7537616.1 YheV family putative metal-binding protein [Pseudoalteromonas sp. OOF1S-7]MCG7563893.1 YheV family putative metal-binding protein [Pseudoalteromonas sp. McH1-42]MCO7191069.1 YheV family putative metal-binding protein [Pseudoalteromonas sp. XMcav2-N]ALU43460.1 DNA-binding protein [Pseudoalteromonas rubra]AZZ99819.1 YheV family putative metal-binding protein [Pseudoalteromonas sp. R3]
MRKKKRFIAGASCPECHEADVMMLYKEHDVEKVECVKCGHIMTQPKEAVQASTRQFEQVIGVFRPE